MFARVQAAFGLICISALVVFAEPPGIAPNTLLVYLDAGNLNVGALPAMRRETEKLLRTAGYTVEWREARGRRGESAPNLAFVDLSGNCGVSTSPAAAPNSLADDSAIRLASTPVEDGVVLPFSRVDCSSLTNVLSPLLIREPGAQRTYYYGRAIGRLIAHELYHVLAQTRDHASAGVGKPCFTPGDLIADRFEFESTALARLQRPSNRELLEDTTNAARR